MSLPNPRSIATRHNSESAPARRDSLLRDLDPSTGEKFVADCSELAQLYLTPFINDSAKALDYIGKAVHCLDERSRMGSLPTSLENACLGVMTANLIGIDESALNDGRGCDPSAYYLLGMIYHKWPTRDITHSMAMKYFKDATEGKHAGANFRLGVINRRLRSSDSSGEPIEYFERALALCQPFESQSDPNEAKTISLQCHIELASIYAKETYADSKDKALFHLNNAVKLTDGVGNAHHWFELADTYSLLGEKWQSTSVKCYKKTLELAPHQGAIRYRSAFYVPEHYFKQSKPVTAMATLELGERYFLGNGVGKDASVAFKFFMQVIDMKNEQAFDLKHVLGAHYYLGVMYGTGDGVAKNESEAFKHFELAFKERNIAVTPYRENISYQCTKAGLELHNRYLHGVGVEQSNQKALEVLTNIIDGGRYVDRELQLCAAYQRISHYGKPENDWLLSKVTATFTYTCEDWNKKLPEPRDPAELNRLRRLAAFTCFVPHYRSEIRDHASAQKFASGVDVLKGMRRTEEKDVLYSISRIYLRCDNEFGVKADSNLAVDFLKKAHEAKHANAARELGTFYASKNNKELATHWYKEAVNRATENGAVDTVASNWLKANVPDNTCVIS